MDASVSVNWGRASKITSYSSIIRILVVLGKLNGRSLLDSVNMLVLSSLDMYFGSFSGSLNILLVTVDLITWNRSEFLIKSCWEFLLNSLCVS